MTVLTPEQFVENEEQIAMCKRQIARVEAGTDPDLPEPKVITLPQLLSSYRAMLRMYEKMRDDHIRETPDEDLA